MEKVKCKDCGYVGFRKKDGSSGLLEMGYGARTSGETADRLYIPECLLLVQLGVNRGNWIDQNAKEIVSTVINAERECRLFTKLKPGYSPKEHKDMNDRKWNVGLPVFTTIICAILGGIWNCHLADKKNEVDKMVPKTELLQKDQSRTHTSKQ